MEPHAERHRSVELRSRAPSSERRTGGRQTGCERLKKELNRQPTLVLTTDSTSAANSTKRRGLGRMRHLDIRELWLQDEIRNGALKVERVEGLRNVADVLTKALPGPRFVQLIAKLGMDTELARRQREATSSSSRTGQEEQR
eukprot:15661335-Heterocapsa_arctica.AAC.1